MESITRANQPGFFCGNVSSALVSAIVGCGVGVGVTTTTFGLKVVFSFGFGRGVGVGAGVGVGNTSTVVVLIVGGVVVAGVEVEVVIGKEARVEVPKTDPAVVLELPVPVPPLFPPRVASLVTTGFGKKVKTESQLLVDAAVIA
jgi:hypothetical protein